MKNGKLVSELLDYHAEMIRLIRSDWLEDAEAACAWAESGIDIDQWQACLDDGWTVAELEAAFERRFGFRNNRKG